ncbi:MGMT family protein [Arthrobacter sp. H41]|uniref:MGMT family protein n=1 Tax=Arthrobacter sp. H41 TaxID=1312978 RepID=UPI0004B3673D|nr:MGMT family protein [Arthrobacter sp. H41]
MSRETAGTSSCDDAEQRNFGCRRNCRRLDYSEAVLEVARLVPAGRVVTYGDVAELLEAGGPRQVGAAMSRGGDDIPWWRVLRAGGLPPRGLAERALEHYLQERTPLRNAVRPPPRYAPRNPEQPGGTFIVDLEIARWVPGEREFEAVEGVRACLRPATMPDSSVIGTEMSVRSDGLES